MMGFKKFIILLCLLINVSTSSGFRTRQLLSRRGTADEGGPKKSESTPSTPVQVANENVVEKSVVNEAEDEEQDEALYKGGDRERKVEFTAEGRNVFIAYSTNSHISNGQVRKNRRTEPVFRYLAKGATGTIERKDPDGDRVWVKWDVNNPEADEETWKSRGSLEALKGLEALEPVQLDNLRWVKESGEEAEVAPKKRVEDMRIKQAEDEEQDEALDVLVQNMWMWDVSAPKYVDVRKQVYWTPVLDDPYGIRDRLFSFCNDLVFRGGVRAPDVVVMPEFAEKNPEKLEQALYDVCPKFKEQYGGCNKRTKGSADLTMYVHKRHGCPDSEEVRKPASCVDENYKEPLTVKIGGVAVTGVHLAPGPPFDVYTKRCKDDTLKAILKKHKNLDVSGVIAGDFNWWPAKTIDGNENEFYQKQTFARTEDAFKQWVGDDVFKQLAEKEVKGSAVTYIDTQFGASRLDRVLMHSKGQLVLEVKEFKTFGYNDTVAKGDNATSLGPEAAIRALPQIRPRARELLEGWASKQYHRSHISDHFAIFAKIGITRKASVEGAISEEPTKESEESTPKSHFLAIKVENDTKVIKFDSSISEELDVKQD